MDNYSFNQIKRMEQEATKRAREASMKAKPLPSEKATNNVSNEHKQNMTQMKKRDSFSFLNALDIKKLIGENSEQAMLLLLILILSHDNTCDEYLIYALIYIML